MQNIKLKNLIPSILFSLVLLAPSFASAESIFLKTTKNTYRVGDSFQVSVQIDAGNNSINTISGKIKIPTDYLQISDLQYGSSIVSLWVNNPTVNKVTGEISFTGGIPGGFNSRTGQILSFGLRAKTAGKTALSTQDISVLLNDGEGTPLTSIANPNLALTILEALPAVKSSPSQPAPPKVAPEVYTPPVDTFPPEKFLPLVSRNQNIGDNKYFVSFATVDKGTGIGHYEINETPWFMPFWSTGWLRAESPYVLSYQIWPAQIMVRAYDQNGNYTDSEAEKSLDPLLASALAAMTFLLIYYIRKLYTGGSVKPKTRVLKYKSK